MDLFRDLVMIKIIKAAPVTSPAYDLARTEVEVRAQWNRHFQSLGSGALNAPDSE